MNPICSSGVGEDSSSSSSDGPTESQSSGNSSSSSKSVSPSPSICDESHYQSFQRHSFSSTSYSSDESDNTVISKPLTQPKEIFCLSCSKLFPSGDSWYNHLLSYEHYWNSTELIPRKIEVKPLVLEVVGVKVKVKECRNGDGDNSCSDKDDKGQLFRSKIEYMESLESLEEFEIVPNKDIRMTEFMTWSEDRQARSIVVSEFRSFISNPGDIMDHFRKFGFITDFIADPEGYFVIIQYSQRSSIKKLTTFPESNRTSLGLLRIRSFPSVSLLEWTIVLNLTSIYDKYDQPYILRYLEMTSEFSKPTPDLRPDLGYQLNTLIQQTGTSASALLIQKKLLEDLTQFLSAEFPKVYLCLLNPLLEGLEDKDSVVEIYLDPFGKCGESPEIPFSLDYVALHYQFAIVQICLILKEQTFLQNLQNLDRKTAGNPRKYPQFGPISLKFFPDFEQDDTTPINRPVAIRSLSLDHLVSGLKLQIHLDTAIDSHIPSFLSYLSNLDSRLVPLLRLTYNWTRLHRFAPRCPQINTILTMTLLSYLMHKKILPSIELLQRPHLRKKGKRQRYKSRSKIPDETPSFVEGWDVTFAQPVRQDLDKHLGKGVKVKDEGHDPGMTFLLLSREFRFLSKLDFGLCVISPFQGSFIPRRLFTPTNCFCLDPGFKLYKENAPLHPLNIDSPMVVQHPFNLSRNISLEVDKELLMEMKRGFCMTSRRIMEELKESKREKRSPRLNAMFPQGEKLMPRRPLGELEEDEEEEEMDLFIVGIDN